MQSFFYSASHLIPSNWFDQNYNQYDLTCNWFDPTYNWFDQIFTWFDHICNWFDPNYDNCFEQNFTWFDPIWNLVYCTKQFIWSNLQLIWSFLQWIWSNLQFIWFYLWSRFDFTCNSHQFPDVEVEVWRYIYVLLLLPDREVFSHVFLWCSPEEKI